MNPNAPIDVSTDRQLFLDDFWIAESNGVRRVLHQPVRREAAIFTEHPWEAGISTNATVVLDRGKYRMWYPTDDRNSDPMLNVHAESADGIVWENQPSG
jgi:hypothetical protein